MSPSEPTPDQPPTPLPKDLMESLGLRVQLSFPELLAKPKDEPAAQE